MAYRQNVTKLAGELGISNDPGLDENDLTIARLEFYTEDGEKKNIGATHMNKGGRLFFQQFSNKGSVLLQLHDMFREAAKAYFDELWDEEPNPDRTLIYALRTFEWVKIHLK
jgi:hypothetical protein